DPAEARQHGRVIEHRGRNKIEIVRPSVADNDRGIERHSGVSMAAKVNVVSWLLHRNVDWDDTTRDLERGNFPQPLDIIKDAIRDWVVDQLDMLRSFFCILCSHGHLP